MRHSYRPILVAVALCAWGCSEPPPPDLARPWTGDPALGSHTVGGVTRPARRVTLPATLPLGVLAAGELETWIAWEAPASGTSLSLRGEGEPARGEPGCKLEPPPEAGEASWQRCRIRLEQPLREARLELRSSAGAAGALWVASPLHARAGAVPKPPVFVVLLDTLRADLAPPFTGEDGPMPALARFGTQGVVFEEARSSSSWTRTALASLFTGLSPVRHQVLDRLDLLPESLEVLPELLSRHGYRTHAWSSNPNVLPTWGFARGFDAFADVGASLEGPKPDASEILGRVLAAVDEAGEGSHFFYVHLMDPHWPYEPGAALRQRAVESAAHASQLGRAAVEGKPGELIRGYWSDYLGEVLDLDTKLDGLFGALRQRDLFDPALVLLVSDHGEEFGDHGALFHGRTLYDEVLRATALLKLPGGALAGTRVTQPVGLDDLMVTLLGVLDAPVPDGLDGRALLERSRQGALVAADPGAQHQLSTLVLDGRRLTSLTDGAWKLIVDHRRGEERLYHVADDALERVDLSEELPDRTRTLRDALVAATAPYEVGWHVRGCGGPTDDVLRFAVDGPTGDLELRLFESDDVRADRTGGVDVTLRLPTSRRLNYRFDPPIESLAPDEDELLLRDPAGGAEPPTLRALGDDELVVVLGERVSWLTGREIPLAAHREAATTPVRLPITCFPPGFVPAAHAKRPYLRVWYVASAAALPADDLDPAVQERLRALGYEH